MNGTSPWPVPVILGAAIFVATFIAPSALADAEPLMYQPKHARSRRYPR